MVKLWRYAHSAVRSYRLRACELESNARRTKILLSRAENGFAKKIIAIGHKFVLNS